MRRSKASQGAGDRFRTYYFWTGFKGMSARQKLGGLTALKRIMQSTAIDAASVAKPMISIQSYCPMAASVVPR